MRSTLTSIEKSLNADANLLNSSADARAVDYPPPDANATAPVPGTVVDADPIAERVRARLRAKGITNATFAANIIDKIEHGEEKTLEAHGIPMTSAAPRAGARGGCRHRRRRRRARARAR